MPGPLFARPCERRDQLRVTSSGFIDFRHDAATPDARIAPRTAIATRASSTGFTAHLAAERLRSGERRSKQRGPVRAVRASIASASTRRLRSTRASSSSISCARVIPLPALACRPGHGRSRGALPSFGDERGRSAASRALQRAISFDASSSETDGRPSRASRRRARSD